LILSVKVLSLSSQQARCYETSGIDGEHAGCDVNFHMKNAVTLALLVMAPLFLNGCGQPPDSDVTKNPRYFFSSFANTLWRTKDKTALMKVKLYTGKQVTTFVPRDAFDPTDPQYRPTPGMQLVSIVPPGALLRINRLLQDNGIGSQVNVIASLESETNSDTTNLYLDAEFLANNSFFRGPVTLHRWGVNSNLLETVTNSLR
jgi:hypothetical protein